MAGALGLGHAGCRLDSDRRCPTPPPRTGSALLAQALGLLLPPLHYMRLAALTFVASTLCVVWALYVPQAAEALYYVSASLAAAWLPISPFVFFDCEWAGALVTAAP